MRSRILPAGRYLGTDRPRLTLIFHIEFNAPTSWHCGPCKRVYLIPLSVIGSVQRRRDDASSNPELVSRAVINRRNAWEMERIGSRCIMRTNRPLGNQGDPVFSIYRRKLSGHRVSRVDRLLRGGRLLWERDCRRTVYL